MKDPVDIKATCFLHFKLKKKKERMDSSIDED